MDGDGASKASGGRRKRLLTLLEVADGMTYSDLESPDEELLECCDERSPLSPEPTDVHNNVRGRTPCRAATNSRPVMVFDESKVRRSFMVRGNFLSPLLSRRAVLFFLQKKKKRRKTGVLWKGKRGGEQRAQNRSSAVSYAQDSSKHRRLAVNCFQNVQFDFSCKKRKRRNTGALKAKC